MTMPALRSAPDLRPPVVVVHDITGHGHPQPQPVEPGSVPAAHQPGTPGPLMCRLNGEWLLREWWPVRRLQAGDVLEWMHVPAQGEGTRTALQVAIAVVSIWNPLGWGMIGAMAFNVAANLAVSTLVDVGEQAQRQQGDDSPTYSTNLSGNQARLDAPIPEHVGYHRRTPDLAAQPYAEYDAEGDSGAGDQYYHALMCVGLGEYAVRRVMIDDTLIDHFGDVEYNILPPGTAPTLVDPAVSTAPEVSGQDLLTGEYIGGFAACAPRRRCAAIGVDFVAPMLGIAEADGDMSARTVMIRTEVREIDDWGLLQGNWQVLGTESITAATTRPVRRSFKYTLSTAARVEVRVVRLDVKSDNRDNYDDITWAGLRAYLDDVAPLCAHATYLELRMRASKQLSGLSQRRVALTAVRKLRTWHPSTGWSSTLAETRNPAWALAHKWSDTVSGDGLADSQIDLQGLYDLAQLCDSRQDHCDYVFDSLTDSDSADQLIASTCRAVVVKRHGVRMAIRDGAVDVPVAAFTARNIAPDGWSVSYAMHHADSPDGVRVTYIDNRSWDTESIDCPMPGVSSMARPEVVHLPGITGATQAERQGLFLAAAMLYRRGGAQWRCEMDGALPGWGAPVRFAPGLIGWGQSGDVVDVDGSTLTLSEPPQWTSGAEHYIALVDDTGTPADLIVCTPGATSLQVSLAASPGVTITVDDGLRERTRYLFGTADELGCTVRLRSLRPEGRQPGAAQEWTLTGLIDDDRVHAADESLLPAVGEEQDPIDDGSGESSGGGTALVVYLERGEWIGGYDGTSTSYHLLPDGRVKIVMGAGVITYLPGQWIRPQPVDAGDAALYEVRRVGGTAGTSAWESLSIMRGWTVSPPEIGELAVDIFRVEIREVASGITMASARITLAAGNVGEGGGV